MYITSATRMYDEYGNLTSFNAVINGVTSSVPNSEENSDYKVMMEEVAAGQLIIQG